MSDSPVVEIEVVSNELGKEWLAQMKNAAPQLFAATEELIQTSDTRDRLPEVIFETKKTFTKHVESVSIPLTENAESQSQPGYQERLTKQQPESVEPIFHDPEIEKIVDEVVARFANRNHTVLMFVGPEQNPEIDSACARVAGALAQRQLGKTLLIDSEFTQKSLTATSGQTQTEGLSEFLAGQSDWESLVLQQPNIRLSFLAAGNRELTNWLKPLRNVSKLIEQASSEYRFVCVAAGDAHSKASELWADKCDGSYLIVDLQATNKTVARSAVEKLSESGSEILGCIVA